MSDPTIRSANVAVLFRLQASDGVPVVPDPTTDAIPVESDSITWSSPWTSEASNEATGSLVAGAPLIIGQPCTFGFKSRIKGAGAGVTYTAAVKPPLHAPLQACGWRGQFHAAIAAAAATAGDQYTATLPAGFPAVSRAVMGLILVVTAGAGAGKTPAIVEYSAGRVATFAEPGPFDATSQFALPASWSYAQTSPSDAASRLVDQPAGTAYIYQDGTLVMISDARGTFTPDGKSARPGYGTFQMTGIYQGKVDAAVPANLVIAGHSAPVLVQADGKSPALSLNGKPLPVSTWSLDAGSQLETPDDPNTNYGFQGGQIVDRAGILKFDPLATLVAVRDTISDIGVGTTMTSVIRHGTQAGNRWALVTPLAQPMKSDPGTRGKLASENIELQCRSKGRDSVGRDTDRTLVFF